MYNTGDSKIRTIRNLKIDAKIILIIIPNVIPIGKEETITDVSFVFSLANEEPRGYRLIGFIGAFSVCGVLYVILFWSMINIFGVQWLHARLTTDTLPFKTYHALHTITTSKQ